MIEIVTKSIELQRVIESVSRPSAGAVDVFIGTTRNCADGKEVLSLEYEAYEPMAKKILAEIASEARSRWDLVEVSIVHRIGRVEVGQASIAIAVSSAHRSQAFEACRFIIDTIKKSVPIWKREFYSDGERWVGMQGDSLTPA